MWTKETVLELLNPFYAINIHPILAEPHEPIVDEELWVRANVSAIRDMGPEAYLRSMLTILKGESLLQDDES